MRFATNAAGQMIRIYDSLEELYREFLMELGISFGSNCILYDQDTDLPIIYKDNQIKVSSMGIVEGPIYTAAHEIAFEPNKNFGLIKSIFNFYITKCSDTDDGDILGGYIADYIDDNETKDKQRVVVKTYSRGLIESNFYYNIYLAFIDCCFKIGGTNVDLSNFDIPPV